MNWLEFIVLVAAIAAFLLAFPVIIVGAGLTNRRRGGFPRPPKPWPAPPAKESAPPVSQSEQDAERRKWWERPLDRDIYGFPPDEQAHPSLPRIKESDMPPMPPVKPPRDPRCPCSMSLDALAIAYRDLADAERKLAEERAAGAEARAACRALRDGLWVNGDESAVVDIADLRRAHGHALAALREKPLTPSAGG